jgi:ribosome maturation factor RimP
MTDKAEIERLVRETTEGSGIFLVGIRISTSNRITILADSNEGITIEECAAIHRHIENNLDREKEDFELQVSSPGLNMPFVVPEQYHKNEGKKVEVVSTEGERFTGLLKNVTRGGFELELETKVRGKASEPKEISFNFDQVKSTSLVFTFK